MLIKKSNLYLLAFPIALMGAVDMLFAGIARGYGDEQVLAFFEPGLAYLIIASFFLLAGKGFDPSKIRYRDTLFFAVITWVLMGLLGAVPIALVTHVSVTDAVFESISGLTTTGATILTGLDLMPPSFLLYRQFLQWLGGLGIVIFVVAILPMLNVGGMKLLRAETPGPMKDEKLSPRIAHTAHYLWIVYVLLTIICALSYYLVGMTAFDAIAHSLTTISTGGFSTHDASMGYFDSFLVLLVADIFMILGAISFALHFKVWSRFHPAAYLRDEETRVFIIIIAVFSIIISISLMNAYPEMGTLSAVSNAVFLLISFITSTGYGTSGFTEWPVALTLLLVIAAYFGGCAGSTAGGNKIIRNIITGKLIGREIKRLIHPSGVFHIKMNNRSMSNDIIGATLAFMFISALTTVVFTILLTFTGLDFWSSLTAVAACINVLGPAFGELGSNFQPVSDTGTWMLSFAMILGRLEYFTLLALVLPAFWRR